MWDINIPQPPSFFLPKKITCYLNRELQGTIQEKHFFPLPNYYLKSCYFCQCFIFSSIVLYIFMVFQILSHSHRHWYCLLNSYCSLFLLMELFPPSTPHPTPPPRGSQLSLFLHVKACFREDWPLARVHAEILITQLCLLDNYVLIKPVLVIPLPIDND